MELLRLGHFKNEVRVIPICCLYDVIEIHMSHTDNALHQRLKS